MQATTVIRWTTCQGLGTRSSKWLAAKKWTGSSSAHLRSPARTRPGGPRGGQSRVRARRVAAADRERTRPIVASGLSHALGVPGGCVFLVVADDLKFNHLPENTEVPNAKQANRKDGSLCQRNLFDITTEDDLNQFENKVAPYLDQQARLFFW